MDAWLQRVWYGRSLWMWLLLPLSLVFAIVIALRRFAFRVGLLRTIRVDKPVIVVGNISVGGTGKTPLVIWLAEDLARRGFKPAVITRGYGGQSATWPVVVTRDSNAELAGDEAVLIAQRTDAIVVSGPDRVADARLAIERGADVVISDDGLQHYRLARDFEIAVVDAARCFGNRFLLPAGPLREFVSRLSSVNAVVVTCREPDHAIDDQLMRWRPSVVRTRLGAATSLLTNENRSLDSFRGTHAHAVAGIGNPTAFFSALRAFGIEVDTRALPDHASITQADLEFNDAAPVFMTEKDAVKCRALADARCFVVPLTVDVQGDDALIGKIESTLRRMRSL